MDGFREFFEAVAHSEDMRARIMKMFADGVPRKDIFMRTGVHVGIIDKIIHDFKATRDVSPVPKTGRVTRFVPGSEENIKSLHASGVTPYQIYKQTGISYAKINQVLGIEGPGAPRKFTEDQKARIVSAAVNYFYGDSEIARLLGVQNRSSVTKIIAPYLTPAIILKRQQRLLLRDKKTLPLDQIPPFENYRSPEAYNRPVSPTPLPGGPTILPRKIRSRPITAQGFRGTHDFPTSNPLGNYELNR